MTTEMEKTHQNLINSLTPYELKELTDKSKRMCIAEGILFKDKNQVERSHHIPLTLIPSPFPSVIYEKLVKLQLDVNTLLHKISQDSDFLKESLKDVAKEDIFVGQLLDILKKVPEYKFPQRIFVGIIRSDYMIDDVRSATSAELNAYLIEYNTVSVSFAAQGSQLPSHHEAILDHLWSMRNVMKPPFLPLKKGKSVLQDIGCCLTGGWAEYVKAYKVKQTCILFVVQPNERNIADHGKLEKETMNILKSHIKMIEVPDVLLPVIFYVTLKELENTIEVKEIEGGRLVYRPDPTKENIIEVALVYFRSCYCPNDFKFESSWQIREKLELNRAIKVPSIGLQLTGCKKIQQILFSQSILSKFVSKVSAEKIFKSFTGIYSLDDSNPDLESIIKKVYDNPSHYVLKPQREGGGNNLYDEEMITLIKQHRDQGKPLTAYTLMNIIRPTEYDNYVVLPDSDKPVLTKCIGEIGIFGSYLYQDKSELINLSSGYIYRTKCSQEHDGGVASGRAVLDSICPFDTK